MRHVTKKNAADGFYDAGKTLDIELSVTNPRYRTFTLTGLVAGVAVGALVRGAAAHPYAIDASRSSATIEVGKSGAFSFAAGHMHEVLASAITGTIAGRRLRQRHREHQLHDCGALMILIQ